MKVTFETAKLAKEKGFMTPLKTTYNNKGEYVEGWVHKMEYGKNLTTYLAPSQSRLQKWLRENHNIDCESMRALYSVPAQYVYTVLLDAKQKFRCEEIMYSSYEEALEVGLQKSLTLV